MKYSEIYSILSNRHKGTFTTIYMKSEPTLSAAGKKSGVTIYKKTRITVRYGAKHSNMKKVRMAVERGEKVLTHKLPWGNWKKGYEGLFIEHKGNDYVYFVNDAINKIKSDYEINGVTVSEQELKDSGYVQPSYFKHKEKADVLTINCNNIFYVSPVK